MRLGTTVEMVRVRDYVPRVLINDENVGVEKDNILAFIA